MAGEITEAIAQLKAGEDEAVKRLFSASYAELKRLARSRFFGGLTEVEAADALVVSERTVRREWTKARAALRVLLEDA